MGLRALRLGDMFRFFKRDALALFYAMRDPEAPRQAKLIAALAILYAFSPIDLVPDFIPGLGLLDDLILVPFGMATAFRMMPEAVAARARGKVQAHMSMLKKAGLLLLAVFAIWMIVIAVTWHGR